MYTFEHLVSVCNTNLGFTGNLEQQMMKEMKGRGIF